ncbi:hypothetical protein C8T65DRAFT_176537 [Cerioporus squamosus]|nr:hypothetical protein C8T65DRAFT_176537 [Cerioporus squamosus]
MHPRPRARLPCTLFGPFALREHFRNAHPARSPIRPVLMAHLDACLPGTFVQGRRHRSSGQGCRLVVGHDIAEADSQGRVRSVPRPVRPLLASLLHPHHATKASSSRDIIHFELLTFASLQVLVPLLHPSRSPSQASAQKVEAAVSLTASLKQSSCEPRYGSVWLGSESGVESSSSENGRTPTRGRRSYLGTRRVIIRTS